MTKDQKSAINILYERDDFRYNILWEFCERNGISVKDAILYIAETFAPSSCSGCKYVGPYMGNWRCHECSRNFIDHFVASDTSEV